MGNAQSVAGMEMMWVTPLNRNHSAPLPTLNVLVAISKGTLAVNLHSNKIPQLFTGRAN